jgi:glucosamine--fructose-6-phosphate aminotransferase (isomerizing)
LRDGYRDALVACGNRLIGGHADLVQSLATNRQIGQVFFLGSGPRYGLACEASLKLKEMSQTVSEPFHFFEFRHGPISMVDRNTLVVGLVSEAAHDYETAVLDEVRAVGGRTLSATCSTFLFSSSSPITARWPAERTPTGRAILQPSSNLRWNTELTSWARRPSLSWPSERSTPISSSPVT